MLPAMRTHVIPAVLGLAIGIFTAGVPVPASGGTPSGPPANYNLDDVTIELERTSCFGSCPVYQLTIRGTGNCTYSGRQFVGWRGDAQFELDPATIVGLLNDLYDLDFFVRRDVYTKGETVLLQNGTVEHLETRVTDVPHLILTVRILDYRKSVSMIAIKAFGGPPELLAFGAKIDSLTASSQWIKGASR